jgi:acyl carrier protein
MELEELFSAVLDVDATSISDGSGRDTLANWTSLAHIDLVTALEERYSVAFSTREIRELRSVGETRRLLLDKGVVV